MVNKGITMNTQSLARDLLRLVGGEDNVATLVHCATRLRFTLRSAISATDVSEIEALDGVVTTVNSAGQFQVVIGNRVPEVYRAFGAISGLLNDSPGDRNTAGTSTGNASVLGKLVDLVSSIFTPLLGAMAAAGVLKGVLAIVLALGWLSGKDSTFVILHAASDSLFYFLPMLLAITSARKFDTNIFVAVSIAGALVYPTIQGLFDAGRAVTFLGMPVVMMKYTSSVLPIILAVWVMSHAERFLNRRIHESVRNILTPCILLVVMVPLTLMTIGPIGISASKLVASVFVTIYEFNPILASALIAAAWQILVIFGVHWGFVSVFINDLSVMGRSFLKASSSPSVFAQSGALLAVMLRTRDTKLRALAGSTFVASLFGITEPGVYGVTLKLKKPFICAVIAAAIGGGVVGYAKSSAISMGMPSLLTLPIFYGDGFIGFVLGCAIAFGVSLVLTLLVGFEDSKPATETAGKPVMAVQPAPARKRAAVAENLGLPIQGEIIPLSAVDDKVFSSGIVGPGVAIRPQEGCVYSPVEGQVVNVYASGHAIGLRSRSGAEVLIHVGIDTVQLEGRHYQMKVAQGEWVSRGQLLLEFDLAAIKAAGYDATTPVIVINADDYRAVDYPMAPQPKVGETIIALS